MGCVHPRHLLRPLLGAETASGALATGVPRVRTQVCWAGPAGSELVRAGVAREAKVNSESGFSGAGRPCRQTGGQAGAEEGASGPWHPTGHFSESGEKTTPTSECSRKYFSDQVFRAGGQEGDGCWSALTACWLCFKKDLGAVREYKKGGKGGGKSKHHKNPA